MSFAAMTLIGFLLDAAIGWPKPLFQRISHPVVWIGRLITALEGRLNQNGRLYRLLAGAVTVLVVCAVTGGIAALVILMLPDGPAGIVIGGVLCWPWIATRSMHDHVRAVSDPLNAGDLEQARHAVSMIVGRDPSLLDAPGIARATLESLAENASDGIVAPVFWGVVGGLPGIAIYKAINTMDSMIGHRSDRYEAFGKTAARLDDLVNLIPARLSGLLFALAAGKHWRLAVDVMRRDAGKHRSPNAGWPEGAMAGALGVRLSGPRIYGDHKVDEPWVNETCPDPRPSDLRRGIWLYIRAMGLLGLALAAIALL
ncbi:MAG: adenosylcobinamide-phosphate synthase CbiB [Pelagimonas sp.]|jgi:adenosylcobinamide-phosphate synthase|nr:adenosylcobinamide-phosphate synthase CbiB [Pelagimonas sp.]